MGDNIMVSISDLRKTFVDDSGPFDVLRGANLSINKGEMLALVGQSGAGKTTLLQIVGGLDRGNGGSVIVEGCDLSKMSFAELAEFRCRRMGFVFQFHHLMPDFTALENVCIPGMIAGAKRSECDRRAKELLDIMGLSHRFTHFPSELSGGERQRVALARALYNNPALVLADEPTGNLDTTNSMALIELFKKLNRELSQTFLVATHNEHFTQSLGRAIFIEDGLIRQE